MFNLFKKKKIEKTEVADSVISSMGIGEPSREDYEKEIENNVNIHVMPGRFRVAHAQGHKAKKAGMFIIIGGILLLIGISVLLYFYLTKWGVNKPGTVATSTAEEVVPEKKETSLPPEPPKEEKKMPTKGPRESYLEMRADFDRAVTFSDLELITIKYGSKSRIAEIVKHKEQIAANPDLTNSIISLLTANIPKSDNIGNISEEFVGQENATLKITAKDYSAEGVAQIVIEDGAWKLISESWQTKAAPVAPAETITNGADQDGDGLTDKEEALLGTDLSKADSDGDNYNDLAETQSLYNPAGQGKMETSSAIKKYENSTYKYGILYPANWTLSNVGGDDSIVVQSNDNHFIQIIAQPNRKNQSIEDWYKEQFSVESVNDALKTEVNGLSGIKNDNGLIIYITDKNNGTIYTITYNLGENNVIEYKNIFEMIIKSFTISG